MTDIDLEGLDRVDKVSSLIKKLVEGGDDNERTLKDIDNFLSKKDSKGKDKLVFDKTVINKPSSATAENGNGLFLRDLERDAAERSQRKAQARANADIIKGKANDYFKACDYEKAIKYYSRAIDECRDYDILYTNRAQAYLKVDNTAAALADCETALRISPANHKALLHQGRSLARLGRYDDALASYRQVVQIAPKLHKYMDEFLLDAAKLQRHAQARQISAAAFDDAARENNAVGVILERLLRNEERVEYYIGGLELLIKMYDDDNQTADLLKTDFKLSKGIFDEKSEIQKRFRNIWTSKIQNATEMEWDLLSLWMQLLKKIIREDDECTIKLFNDSSIIACLDFCCKSAKQLPFSLLSATISLLYYMSNLDIGLQQIFDKFTVSSILSVTLTSINMDQKKEVVIVGMALFHNLVTSQRFKVALSKDEKLIMAVIDCLQAMFMANLCGSCGELPSVISVIELLADNNAIRMQLIKHDNFLDGCMNTIEARLSICDDENHSSVLLQLFTLIHNLLIKSKYCPTGGKVRSLCQRIVIAASHLLSNHPVAEMRTVLIQVLSQMLVVLPDDKLKAWCDNTSSTAAADRDNVSMCRSLSRQSSLTDVGYLDKVCKPLKLCITILDAQHHPLLPHAIKILALASKVNQSIRFLCCDVRERVIKLQSLLYKEKQQLDEVFSGNICLLFINSVNETPLAEHLSSTGIIKDLLRICADANKADCRRNAAIFAGNLAQSNHIHRNELSRLNGFNIISKFNNWH